MRISKEVVKHLLPYLKGATGIDPTNEFQRLMLSYGMYETCMLTVTVDFISVEILCARTAEQAQGDTEHKLRGNRLTPHTFCILCNSDSSCISHMQWHCMC